VTSFKAAFQSYEWAVIQERIQAQTADHVQQALQKTGPRTLDDLMALLSPAAVPFLEDMARQSRQLTRKRFGKVVQMYIPLYLSNVCQNICTYCGFRADNRIDRVVLNEEEVLKEIEVIRAYGFDHILLVTGEANRSVGMAYFRRILKVVRPHFAHIAVEIQPLDQPEYEELRTLGVNTVYIYQETYGPRYAEYHPKGKKADFDYRLETPDRLGRAGIHRIGLGALIGLDDWRTDAWFTGLHLDYLRRKFWRTKYSISCPRLRPAAGFQPQVNMTDRQLVQLICTYRLFDENVELSLSTREAPRFRDHVIQLGITSLSAGSKTEPGGYALHTAALEQFAIEDGRSPAEVAEMITRQGYEPVWRDWDPLYG